MKDKKMQTTPKGYDIPVPTREAFDKALSKSVRPVKPSTPHRRPVKK